MRFSPAKSTAIGETSLKRRKLDIVGDNMQDPFFDSYQQEADTSCDILNLIDKAHANFVTLVINKDFLRKLVHSHIVFIRELEKDLKGRTY